MKQLNLLILALTTLTFISCEKNTPKDPPPAVTTGVFILNEGQWEKGDATLALYDPATKQVSHNVFNTLNEIKLGDLGNDMLIYGGKAYIAVSGSKIIFITDLKGKKIGEIKHSSDAGELSPRRFTKLDGKVYVSYQEGYVGQIDTTSYAVKSVKVGPNPEGIVGINNKVYVANSDGFYSNEETAGRPRVKTVSVIDASNLTVTKDIDVIINPDRMTLSDNGSIYLISNGNYSDISAALQKIDPVTDAVTTISGISPGKMSMGKDNKLYLLSSTYDASGNSTSTCAELNTTTDAITKDFITDGTEISNGYSISADPVNGNIYVGAGKYDANGSMYVFTPEGKKLDKFKTGGIYPAGAYFITK